MPWFVKFETRERGAIGAFAWRGLSSGADTEGAAIKEIFEALQLQGFETRGVIAYQYEENQP